MPQCTKCKEKFCVDEVTYLIGDDIVLSEENGGSGDYDQILCDQCLEEYFQQQEQAK